LTSFAVVKLLSAGWKRFKTAEWPVIQFLCNHGKVLKGNWIPACAGMTKVEGRRQVIAIRIRGR
jgi:hypothetical protein